MRVLWLALCWALTAGCGYRFTAGGAPLPESTRAVYAKVFLNQTAEPGVETLFTQSFREQLLRAGTSGDANSEATVEGEILSVSGASTIVLPVQATVASYRITAVARLKLLKNGRVLSETTVSADEDYLPGADVLISESNRQAALHRLADAMMRDGYERLATGG